MNLNQFMKLEKTNSRILYLYSDKKYIPLLLPPKPKIYYLLEVLNQEKTYWD